MKRLLLLLSVFLTGAGPFDQYQLIMWQTRTVPQIEGLRRLGFSGLKLTGSNGHIDPDQLALLRRSRLPWYVENCATDFLSPYHRYTPGKPVTWLFDALKGRLRADPSDIGVFQRTPSLSDVDALGAYTTRLEAEVRDQSRYRPLFYNLADEAGIGDLAAAWDADIGPASLAGMRAWLQAQYPDLDALNRQWGTAFPDWGSVVPELTDAALRRSDDNFSAWSDFKAWMDVAFSRAVRAGTDAVHKADPTALAALEGAQIPGWGGYDYSLLAGATDAMEIYDLGNAVELARAFNPALIVLRTSFGPADAHAAWRGLLLGGRGTIVWDEANDVVRADGTKLPRGRALAATVAAIRAVAPVLFASRPSPDPVAVLVSQASFRTRWILDRRSGDHAWWQRDAAREYEDNAWAASRRQILRRLEEIAVQPSILSSPMLEDGALLRSGARVLLLPHAIALSDREVAAIAAFARSGGTVLADTEPAVFDGHGRRRPKPGLSGIARLPEAMLLSGGADSGETLDALVGLLRDAGAAPRAEIRGPGGAVATGVSGRWLRGEGHSILALQTLAPGNASRRIDIRLGGTAERTKDVPVVLDAAVPTLLTVRDSELFRGR